MSSVTEYLVIDPWSDPQDPPPDAVVGLNLWLNTCHGDKLFERLDTESLGGFKRFGSSIWAVALNYSSPPDVLHSIANQEWEYPEDTVVWVSGDGTSGSVEGVHVFRVSELEGTGTASLCRALGITGD